MIQVEEKIIEWVKKEVDGVYGWPRWAGHVTNLDLWYLLQQEHSLFWSSGNRWTYQQQ